VRVGAISTSTSSLGSLLRCRVLMAAAMPPVLMIVSRTSMPVAASHLGMRVLRAMLALLPAMTSTGASEPVWDTPVVGSHASTFFGCCASADAQRARSIAHTAKLPSFRLFISPSHLTQRAAMLVLCLNLGRTYTFHCQGKSGLASKYLGF